MFYKIFRYEIRRWLGSPLTYFYLVAFLGLSILTMAGFSGIMGPGSVETNSVANSPLNIFSVSKLYWKLVLVLVPAIVGHAFYVDFKTDIFKLLYSFPIEKKDYLLAKFLSSFLLVIMIAFMIGLGFSIGTVLPGVQAEHLIPWSLQTYLVQYFLFILPNLLFICLIVASVVALSRSVFAGFISIIIVFILAQILMRVTGLLQSPSTSILLDPFGELGIAWKTRDWSTVQKNSQALPIGLWLIANRVLWLLVGFLVAGFAYAKLTLSHLPYSFSSSIRGGRAKSASSKSRKTSDDFQPSSISLGFSKVQQFRAILSLARTDMSRILFSRMFIVLLAIALVFVVVLISQMNPPYGSQIMPKTWVMLSFPVFFFSLFVHLSTFLYSGLLVHRARISNMDSLIDISPFGNHVHVISKLLAMIGIQCVLLLGVMLSCIGLQIYSGYYKFEIGLYLVSLFGIHLSGFILWAIVSIFVHSLFSNLYFGIFILVFLFFGIPNLGEIGLGSAVFQFNQNPEASFYLNYSDLAGFGHSIRPFISYKLYWFFFSCLIFIGTLLVWPRGLYASLSERLRSIGKRFSWRYAFSTSLILIAFVSLGTALRNAETAEFGSLGEKEISVLKKNAESEYKQKYRGFVQPRVTEISAEVDLFPSEKRLEARGRYRLVNKSENSIENLLIHYAGPYEKKYSLSVPHSYVSQDSLVKFDVLKLDLPLEPGEEIEVEFTSRSIPNTWFQKRNSIESNGAFVVSSLGLEIGYYTDTSDLSPTDSLARRNHYRAIDSDYVDLELTLSTDRDQRIVASGILQKEWTEAGRNFYRYVSNDIATRDYAFCSGRYELAQDKWKNVEIEFYYHKGHDYNIATIFNGLKKTLEYNEKHFGPYQHPKIKIAEYSRSLGNYVQAYAGLLTWSEISLIIDPNGGSDLNLPFLGASHELAHQWWGHQVIPADVMGSKLINEGMSEYVSSQVLKHEYGVEALKMFRLRQRRDYLRNRNKTRGQERPLMYNKGLQEPQVPYQKGSMVLSTLSDYLGEEKLNEAIGRFYTQSKFPSAPYPTSIEFVDEIRLATPDSLAYLIEDLFESVRFYDLRVDAALTSSLDGVNYILDLNFSVNKIEETKDGDKDVNVDDYIQIDVLGDGRAIHSAFHKVHGGENHLQLELSARPEKVSLDPMVHFIEKDREDNEGEVEAG